MASSTQQLSLVSAIDFESRAPDGFPLTSPTLDLSANWESGERQLLIYRPSSQLFSKIHQAGTPGGKAPDALAVTWKADGQFLAIGWSDGVVRLVGLENNKTAHHIDVCPGEETKITHIGWTSSTISGHKSSAVLDRLKNDMTKELRGHSGDKSLANLPRELTFLEVETALPKISPLPTASAGAGEDAIVFTLRTGIDFLFQAPDPDEYNQVDVMIVGTNDGRLQLSIHDSFIIGSLQCPLPRASPTASLIRLASHPQISTQGLIFANQTSRPNELYLIPMDMPFISSSPVNLSLLTSKLTTLQKLLRYIHQTQLHMQVEWKNTRELPDRFLRSVEGDLETLPKGPRNIVPALYHTVVTGHAYEPVREWLCDNLAERGHKRWDKAVTSGLQNLRGLVHENFLPALERCSIILSRLRGLAIFYDKREDMGFSVPLINRIMDLVACLNLAGHEILLRTMDELEHFQAFSVWLRSQIDRLASSSETEELTEKEATMDNGKVLTYIERYLTRTPLALFFEDIPNEIYTQERAAIKDNHSLLELLSDQLKKHKSGQPAMKALPQVGFLVDSFTTWSNTMFRDIAEDKKRRVRFGQHVKLGFGYPIDRLDVTTGPSSDKSPVVFTALASKEVVDNVYLFRTRLEIINGISTNKSCKVCPVELANRKLIDLKFLADKSLVLLCNEPDGTPVVMDIPIHADTLPFTSYEGNVTPDMPRYIIKTDQEYRLPEEHAMKPLRMEVHDKTDVRGQVPERICLLGSNRTTLRTFTFPSSRSTR